MCVLITASISVFGPVERKVCVRRRLRVAASRGELPVERVPSAEKRKYSQYKCSVGEFSCVLCLLTS